MVSGTAKVSQRPTGSNMLAEHSKTEFDVWTWLLAASGQLTSGKPGSWQGTSAELEIRVAVLWSGQEKG